jgi:hypothetical protein
MTHETEGSMGSKPSQANFLGYLALGLMALTLVVTLVILVAALTHGG